VVGECLEDVSAVVLGADGEDDAAVSQFADVVLEGGEGLPDRARAEGDAGEAVFAEDASPQGVVQVEDQAFAAAAEQPADHGAGMAGEHGDASQRHGLFGPVPVAGVEPGFGAGRGGEAFAVDDGDGIAGRAAEGGVEAAQHRQTGGGEPGGQVPEGDIGWNRDGVLDHPGPAAGRQRSPQTAKALHLRVDGGVGGARVLRLGGQ
jgi:hypothetical protein